MPLRQCTRRHATNISCTRRSEDHSFKEESRARWAAQGTLLRDQGRSDDDDDGNDAWECYRRGEDPALFVRGT